MAKQSKGEREPSREQARIWLATVIAPIVNGLETELRFAERGDWSFRWYLGDLEYLTSIGEMVAAVYEPNLRQFWRYHPSLQRQAQAHDLSLEQLRLACHEAHAHLLDSPDFRRLAADMPAMNLADAEKYYADEVVNGRRELSDRKVHADAWGQRGGEFLALRSNPALAPYFAAVAQAGEAFRRVVAQAATAFGDCQQDLAAKFKLPPIDPAGIAAT
ncbi:MAG TPA: hypothetical protein VGQ83_16745 [Polyangia bacterium]